MIPSKKSISIDFSDSLHNISKKDTVIFKKRKVKKDVFKLLSLPEKYYKKINHRDLKESLSSLVEVLPLFSTATSRSANDVTKIYEQLDALQAQGKKDEFKKLVIQTVESLGFINPKTDSQYETELEYALPYCFLTGMKCLICKIADIATLLIEADRFIHIVRHGIDSDGVVPLGIKSNCVALQVICQLNLLLINNNMREENVVMYMPEPKDDYFECAIFKKEQYSDVISALNALGEFAYEVSEGRVDSATDMIDYLKKNMKVICSCSIGKSITSNDFMCLVKECVLKSTDPFSMLSLSEVLNTEKKLVNSYEQDKALPIFMDTNTFQLLSLAEALPTLEKKQTQRNIPHSRRKDRFS